MRSILALLVCTGLIAWAHTTKHKYLGLRASQPASLAVMPGQDNNGAAADLHRSVFHLPFHNVYLHGVSAMYQDSIGRRTRFGNSVTDLWQLQ